MRTLLFLIALATSCMAMEIVDPAPSCLADPVPTELTAYTLLKAQPLATDVTYAAVPWVGFKQAGRLQEALGLFARRGFTVCQTHVSEIIPYCKAMGIKTIFAVHAIESEVEGIRVVPFPHYPVHGAVPAEKKDIWYSFVGMSRTHPCREKIRELAHRPGAHIIFRNGWVHSSEEEIEEYRDVIARSRFSLCPRGTAPHSIRFWESLQAGAIPVLISNEILLPPGCEWERAIVRVQENEIDRIPSLLARISPEEEAAMRRRCLAFFARYVEGENFVQIIREHYKNEAMSRQR